MLNVVCHQFVVTCFNQLVKLRIYSESKVENWEKLRGMKSAIHSPNIHKGQGSRSTKIGPVNKHLLTPAVNNFFSLCYVSTIRISI